jgi:toxin YhaV
VIVLAWVNDEDTKRAYESNDDAYRVFRKMLESGHPPDDWNALRAQAHREHDGMGRAITLPPDPISFESRLARF